MDHLKEFILRDVRCFEGDQRGQLRPITLLIGENSTGKTTFLGCYRVLHRVFSERGLDPLPDFNGEPFTMGSFRDIVRSRLGPRGRIEEFKLGFHVDVRDSGMPPYELIVTFRENGSQPEVASLRFQFKIESESELFLELQRSGDGTTVSIPDQAPMPIDFHFESVPFWLDLLAMSTEDHDQEIRNCNSLHDELVAFGRDSGLFSDIKVKRHGKQMSDPFQLQVKVRSGPHANIMDVGYGVSQSLPILVDIMADKPARGRKGNGDEGRTFLLQQPEVHLHPRGQAQLANLFIEAYRKRGSRFLIETHSDYIVDRVRISVRKELLKPDDVSILYFEPNGRAAKIHNLSLDAHGNLQGAPSGYRDFFLKETDRLLGFAD